MQRQLRVRQQASGRRDLHLKRLGVGGTVIEGARARKTANLVPTIEEHAVSRASIADAASS